MADWENKTADEEIAPANASQDTKVAAAAVGNADWGSSTANDGDWATAPANASQDTKDATADDWASPEPKEAPAADAPVAPPKIAFKPTACVAILTDPKGNDVSIGHLRAADTLDHMIQMGVLNENREVSLFLRAHFPKLDGGPGSDKFQRMGLYFYGDAFRKFDSDFVITPVNNPEEISGLLSDRESVTDAMGKDLHKLCLTYQPDKVVTKAKDDPEEFAMPESSRPAGIFKSLVERKGPVTLILYFRARSAQIDALHALKGRLQDEQDFVPFKEYRDKNGNIRIQFAAVGTDHKIDVRSRLSRQLNFRSPERHAATLAYGEIREHDYHVLLVRSTLETPVSISFVAVPGLTDKSGLPTQYIGFPDMPDTDSIGQLFQVGTDVTLCFDQPLLTAEPQGWRCTVKQSIPNIEHPGSMVLIATRPAGSTQQVNVAKFPTLEMRAESDHTVWLYPHGSDLPCKRLTNCANKLLYGEPEEDEHHRSMREKLQKFCAGLEYSSVKPPTEKLFDKSRLTSEQLSKLNALEARCSKDQRAALEEIYSEKSWINICQGPPGTGKTTFAAEILLSIFEIFGHKANVYTPSNAACDVFVRKIDAKLKPLRFHGLSMEYGSVQKGPPQPRPDDNAEAPESPSDDDPKGTLSDREVAWMHFLRYVKPSNAWNSTARTERPHYGANSMYTRACMLANIMDTNGQQSISLPDDVVEDFLKWARQYYEVDPRVVRPPNAAKKSQKQPKKARMVDDEDASNEDEEGEELEETFRDLTMKLFAATLKSTNYVVTTCSNAADHLLRTNTSPVIVIVDEAGVAKELESLLAIYHNLGTVVMVIFIGDHHQLHPTVLSYHAKLDKDDKQSLPFNIFAPQLAESLMGRSIENGMRYTMFTEQYRMTAGLEALSSVLCYNGRLQNAHLTLLANREKSILANAFIRKQFDLVTDVPHVFLNVPTGVCLRSHTMSRKNPQNVIVDLYVIEAVLNEGLFQGEDICVVTPYKEQAGLIRQALWRTNVHESLLQNGIRDVKVHTIDSMQGNEAPMVIVDIVLAQKRKGRYGFVANRGRLNVSVSRAKYFQVFVGDVAAAEPLMPKAPAADNETKIDVVDDAEDEELGMDAKIETNMKPIKQLFEFYKTQGVVVNQSHEGLPQSQYVDLTEADAFINDLACKLCGSSDHFAKDCDRPEARIECRRCRTLGHKGANCTNPPKIICRRCGKEGHKGAQCFELICHKCKERGHAMDKCQGPERRTCERCLNVGHLAKDCKHKAFRHELAGRPLVDLEAGKKPYEPTPGEGGAASAWGTVDNTAPGAGAASAWDDGVADAPAAAGDAASAWGDGVADAPAAAGDAASAWGDGVADAPAGGLGAGLFPLLQQLGQSSFQNSTLPPRTSGWDDGCANASVGGGSAASGRDDGASDVQEEEYGDDAENSEIDEGVRIFE